MPKAIRDPKLYADNLVHSDAAGAVEPIRQQLSAYN